jgi:non-specific serine/threonine protein kinase
LSTPADRLITFVVIMDGSDRGSWPPDPEQGDRARDTVAALARRSGREPISVRQSHAVPFGDPASALIACAALAEHERSTDPSRLGSLSLSVHSGDDSGANAVESVLIQAVRIVEAAHPGQVVCSSRTAEAAGHNLPGELDFRALGRWRLLDFDQPENLFQLAGPHLTWEFPPLRAVPSAAPNLPLTDASFVGRELEISQVIASLEAAPLVTIVGPGGVGKSRVAYEVARRLAPRFPGGVIAVPLADVTSGDQVIARVAESMGIHEQVGEPLLDSVLAALGRRSTLFILDNSEHVAAEVVSLVDAVMQAVVQIRVLATSRRRLGKVYERVHALGTLEVPSDGMSTEAMGALPSVRLFLDRSAAGGGPIDPSPGSAEAVARICRHLEGLPLALEVVAARATGRSITDLADEIDGTLDVPMDGESSFETLQRTISSTIHWGLSQLTPVENSVFARLSVFRGRFERHDAETVCGFSPLAAADVSAALTALAEASLLVVEPMGQLRILSVIREVAAANLEVAGEAIAARDAHLQFFAALLDRTPGALAGPNQVEWSARIDIEIDNIRAALQWGLQGPGGHDQAARLAASLESYWIRRGLRSEGRSWLEESLNASTGLDRVNALIAAGRLGLEMGDFEPASLWLTEAVESAGSIGATARRAHALGWLAVLQWYQGDYAAAEENLMAALSISEKSGDRHGAALWHIALGALAGSRSAYATASAHHQAALAISELSGDKWVNATALGNLGDVAALCGDYAAAETNMAAAVDITREIGDRSGEGHWLANLGLVAMSDGDGELAAAQLQAGMAMARDVGDRVREAWWLTALAEVAAARDDMTEAASLSLQALDVSETAVLSRAKSMLAFVAHRAGDPDTARRESMIALRALNPDRWLLTTSLVLIAASVGGASAVLIGGSLSSWNEQSGSRIGLPHASWLRQAVDDARADLGDASFATLWDEGRHLPLDDVAGALAARG